MSSESGECDASPFAAGEDLDRGIGRGAAQRGHGDVQMGIEIPGVDLVEFVLQFGLLGDQGVEVGIRFGKFGVDLVVLGEHIHDGLQRAADDFDDGLGLVELRFLLEIADTVALGHGDLADVIGVDAGHDAQQGGLARAVQTEHADFGAVVEAERDVAQDLLVGRHDAPDFVHGVDNLFGVCGHGEDFTLCCCVV